MTFEISKETIEKFSMIDLLNNNIDFVEKDVLMDSFGNIKPFINSAYFMTTKWNEDEYLSTRIVISLECIPPFEMKDYPDQWPDLIASIIRLKRVYKENKAGKDGCVLKFSVPPISLKI